MNEPITHVRSEKGMALIVVLLLLAVMAALTTGLALNGQTEITMASNEAYYAGARAAAEAGMNRALQHITANTTDLLPAGVVPTIANGPFTFGEYTYSFEILDDDNDLLYNTPLTSTQRLQMGEQDPANLTVSLNPYIVVRATGTGPRNTVVRISRVLSITTNAGLPATNVAVLSNPAILVNGSLDMGGNVTIGGLQGNVHANGNITGGGSVDVRGDLTATGTIAAGLSGDGLTAPGQAGVTVPEVKASDYLGIADWILTSGGARVEASTGRTCGGTPAPVETCPTGWSWSSGTATWSASGSMPSKATYYAQTNVEVHGTGKSSMTEVSIIAEGSIKLTGNGKFKPENDSQIQFVTNGDFELGGNVDGDPDYDMDGQIMVREQIKIYGNSTFKGRVIVEDRASGSNAYDATTNPNGRKGSSALSDNTLTGNMTVTYDGTLPGVQTLVLVPGTPTTYTYNVAGWIEQ